MGDGPNENDDDPCDDWSKEKIPGTPPKENEPQ